MTRDYEEPRPGEDKAFWIAVGFVGFALLLAALFVVYALAWDGGAHT